MALISVLVQLIAAIIFPISLLVFTILYCLYGASPFGPPPRSCARSGLGSPVFALANGLPSTSSTVDSPEP